MPFKKNKLFSSNPANKLRAMLSLFFSLTPTIYYHFNLIILKRWENTYYER